MVLRIALAIGLFLVSVGFTATHAIGGDTAYKTYGNVSMTQLGTWTKTDIRVPKGAIVALMAEGEIHDLRSHHKASWTPSKCLVIRIGKRGLPRGVNQFYGSAHVKVFKNLKEGELQYALGRTLKNLTTKMGTITATVMVWDAESVGRAFQDIQGLVAAHPDQVRYKALLISLAECFTNSGEYSKAEMVLKELRETSGQRGREAAMVLIKSSNNEKWLRRYDRVKGYAEGALAISRREGFKGIQGEALLCISEALGHSNKTEEAMSVSEDALQLSRELKSGSQVLAGRAHQILGLLYLRSNAVPEALSHFESSVRALRKAKKWMPLAQSSFYLGQSQRMSEMNEEARKSYKVAIKMAVLLGRSETIWRSHAELGRIAEKEGDKEQALEHYAKSVEVIEFMRAGVEDPALKSQFMGNKLYVYEWMIQLLHLMNRDDEAFHYLERARARLMLDMLSDKIFSSRDKEIGALLIREADLKEQVQELSKAGQGALDETEEDEEGTEFPSEPGDEAKLELERLQSELESVHKKIEELNPDLASLLAVSPLKAGGVQALIGKETALLTYFIGSQTKMIFVVTGERVKAVPLIVPRKELMDLVKEFRKETEEGMTVKVFLSKDYEKPLTDLYEILIKPVEKEIAGKMHLVVVPHGMLHYLPFQALRSPEGKYLIDSYTVSYLPSASVLKYARDKNGGNHANLFAVANPVTDLSPLPAAEVEAREVSALFAKKEVLLGPSATKTTFKKEAPEYDLLLFSTHGEMIESDPLKSNLRFTPTRQDDGKLTVSEIFDMEVKANLVTLSACETGLARGTKGDFPQGDDLVGLSRAFIHAGAPSVVASLWKVSDESTVAMMRSFYSNLQTMPKAEALQKAQRALAKSNTMTSSHPYFWAPFILVGDWK